MALALNPCWGVRFCRWAAEGKCVLTEATAIESLAEELASSGGVKDRLDQQPDVAVVDASDRVAEGDGCLVGEAGRQEEDSAFSARTGKLAGVRSADRGFSVDRCCSGAVVNEAGEVVASSQVPWAMSSPVAASSV
jgi:hypothetical protein